MIYFYSISEYPSENEINQCLDSFRKLHVFTPKSYKKHFKVISFSLFFQCHGSFFSVFFLLIFRTSSSQVFFKICVLKICAIFTGQQLSWSLFLIKSLFKKRLQHRSFPANIVKFLKTTFFIEHLRWLLLSFDVVIPFVY